MAKEGLELVHVIGPKTAHRYHPLAKKQINERIDAIAAKGRNPIPKRIRFTTWTLRYHNVLWVEIDGMEQHWERARVNADIVDASTVNVTPKNVTALTLRMPPGHCPLDPLIPPTVILDGIKVRSAPVLSDRSAAIVCEGSLFRCGRRISRLRYSICSRSKHRCPPGRVP